MISMLIFNCLSVSASVSSFHWASRRDLEALWEGTIGQTEGPYTQSSSPHEYFQVTI
jgi:hypothetical protein